MRQHQAYQHLHYSGPRRRERKGGQNIFDEIMAENFPKMKKEVYPGTRSTDSPKQGEHK